MELFKNYLPTAKNYEELVKLAIDSDPHLSVMMVQDKKTRKKYLRVDFDYEYEKVEAYDMPVIWSEDAGECAKHLAVGEYPVEILDVIK